MRGEIFLLTGAMGCIGAWALRHLLDDGVKVIATDLESEPLRPRLLLSEDEINQIVWEKLDVTDLDAVTDLVGKHKVTHIIHLAGLQIPFCRANPSLGAAVNVQGTINVFEAVRHNGVKGISYASSLGVLGPAEAYPETPIKDDVPLLGTTLYGVFKAANERSAQVYWQEWQVGSVGLRPYNVYGVARDQGMTADIAKAVLATAAGRAYTIRYNGPVALQHASDVARCFIQSARAEYQGAAACNLRNDVVTVEQFIATLTSLYPQAKVSCDDNPLPFPADLDDSGLRGILGTVPHIPLETAIKNDMDRFTQLINNNKIDLTQLDA